jgi:trehalose/maltose hydrolase-like predicted phosphorylase
MRRVEMDELLEPTPDPKWVLAAEGYDPLREHIYEARFTISNGLLGVRGGRAVSRGSGWTKPLRTYVAGLFDIPGPEHAIPMLVSAPGWLRFSIIQNSDSLIHHPTDVAGHRSTLDMRRGILLTTGRFCDSDMAVRARTLRLVSLRERAIGLHVIELQIERGEIDITLEASCEGLGLLISARLENDLGVWQTKYSGKRLAIAAASSLQIDGSDVAATIPAPFTWSWHLRAHSDQTVHFSRFVTVVRSDTPNGDPGRVAWEKLSDARQLGWREVVHQHEAAWLERLDCSYLEVGGDPAAEQTLPYTISTAPRIRPTNAFPSEPAD